MKPWQDFLIFKTDTLFNDKVSFKGYGGREIVLDPKFDPQVHSRIYGEVTATPFRMSRIPLLQETKGLPSYHDYSPFHYKFLSDIEPEAQVGDRVYYHFNTIKMSNFVNITGTHPDRTWFIKVRYDSVICVVRKEKIIPIGSYVLVEPDKETWEDISIPTYSNIKGKDGKPMLKPKEQWIVTKTAPEAKFLQGYVRHIGSPLKGDKCELEVGQKIWYRKWADWTNKIEGQDYYAIKQRHIIGKEVDGKFVPINNYICLEGEASENKVTPAGIILKREFVKSGVVSHTGNGPYSVGTYVHCGDSERQEIKLNGSTFFVIKWQDVYATE